MRVKNLGYLAGLLWLWSFLGGCRQHVGWVVVIWRLSCARGSASKLTHMAIGRKHQYTGLSKKPATFQLASVGVIWEMKTETALFLLAWFQKPCIPSDIEQCSGGGSHTVPKPGEGYWGQLRGWRLATTAILGNRKFLIYFLSKNMFKK